MAAVHPFTLERPTSVAGVLAVLAAATGDARVMAGGQSLTPLLSLGLSSPDLIVSLDRCAELDRIRSNDTTLSIGAMVTTADLEHSERIRQSAPLLTVAARRVGSPHVRNFGTAVGNVCHGDPGSDLIPALLCYPATLQLQSHSGIRSVQVADFVTGPFLTAIDDSEIATSLTISIEGPERWRHGYRKLVKRSGDLAIATCAVRLRVEAGAIETARIVIGGALSRACRLHPLEDALIGCSADEASQLVVQTDSHIDTVDLLPDVDTPLDYLHQMFPRFIAATVADAVMEESR